MDIEQPDAKHVRVVAPDLLGHHRHHEGLRQLDPECKRWHLGGWT